MLGGADSLHAAPNRATCRPQEYLGHGGNPRFCRLAAELALGPDSEAVAHGRVASLQGISGTGSLWVSDAPLEVGDCVGRRPEAGYLLLLLYTLCRRAGPAALRTLSRHVPAPLQVGAAFLSRYYQRSRVALLSSPSWPLHDLMVQRAGLELRRYRWRGLGQPAAAGPQAGCTQTLAGMHGGAATEQACPALSAQSQGLPSAAAPPGRYYDASTRGLDYDGMLDDLLVRRQGHRIASFPAAAAAGSVSCGLLPAPPSCQPAASAATAYCPVLQWLTA